MIRILSWTASSRVTCCRSARRWVSPTHSKGDDSHRAEARRHQSRSVLRSSSTPEPSGPLSPVDSPSLNKGLLLSTRWKKRVVLE